MIKIKMRWVLLAIAAIIILFFAGLYLCRYFYSGEYTANPGIKAIVAYIDDSDTRSQQLLAYRTEKGRLIKRLGCGMEPRFDPSGKRILFQRRHTDIVDDRKKKKANTGEVVIYDIARGRKEYISHSSLLGFFPALLDFETVQ